LVSPDAPHQSRAQTKERDVMGAKQRISGAAMALIAFAQPANAQTAVELPQIVVSPTIVPTPANLIANSITVITGEDLQREQRRTVTDALNAVPGLQVVQNGSSGAQTSVFIRGTNSNHVKVLIDGIDVSDFSNPNGAFDFAHLLTSDIDKIEVLRGPQSGLYGASAIGGLISITTKKGSGPAKVTGMVEGGSYGTFNQAVGVSGSQDKFNYAFNVSHFRYENQPVTPAYMVPPGGHAIGNAYDNKSLSTKLGYDVDKTLSFNFIGYYTDAVLHYSGDDPNSFPGVTFPSQSVYRNRNFYGRGEAVWTLLDGRFVNTFAVNYTNYARDNKDPDPNPQTKFNSMGEKFEWHGAFTVMPGQILVAGLERQNEQATSDNLAAKTGNQAGFLEFQSEIAKRFFFVANIRHDDHDAFGGHDTWRVAPAVIVPVTDTKLKASYGTGFKAPDLYQLYGQGPFGFTGNPGLLPETSRGYDFGFEQPLLNDRVRFGATYYRNDISNLIEFNNTFTSLINVGSAVTYGAEAFVAVTVNDQLRARLDYTRTTAKDLDTDTELLRRPRHKYALTATWQPIDKLTISPTVIYLGRLLDINRSTFDMQEGGGVAIVNLAVNYQLDAHTTVFARADNLFNKQYEEPLGWLQPGLSVYGGVKLTTN
jgi:vitamin B12 transporter